MRRPFTVYAYHPNTNLSLAATDAFNVLSLHLSLVSSAITYTNGVPLPQLTALPGGAASGHAGYSSLSSTMIVLVN